MIDLYDFESVILKLLLFDERYFNRVYPELDVINFDDITNKDIFASIKKFVKKYEKKPNFKEFAIFVSNDTSIDEEKSEKIEEKLNEIKSIEIDADEEFLLNQTEKHIKRTRLVDAIYKSVDILEKGDVFDKVLDLVENAIDVNFDKYLGNDYLDEKDIEKRFEEYRRIEDYIQTGIPTIDKYFGGGMKKRTLNVFVAPTHGGKSMFKVFIAGNVFLLGKNVLYLTFEMGEDEITKRLDSAFFKIPFTEVKNMDIDDYKEKVNKVKEIAGKLIVKEYPNGEFNVIKMKNFLMDLKNEKNFIPDLIVVDYMGIMSSVRMNKSTSSSYDYYKSIAEELHSFAKKENVIILTSFQTNRSAFNNLDADMGSIAESAGVLHPADTVIGILSNKDFKEEKRIRLSIWKNRNTYIMRNCDLEYTEQFLRYRDLMAQKEDYKPITGYDRLDAFFETGNDILGYKKEKQNFGKIERKKDVSENKNKEIELELDIDLNEENDEIDYLKILEENKDKIPKELLDKYTIKEINDKIKLMNELKDIQPKIFRQLKREVYYYVKPILEGDKR